MPDWTKTHKLVHEPSGMEMKIGGTYPDFRGDSCKVIGFYPGNGQGKTGRVIIEDPDSGVGCIEYYPSVINAKVVPR